MKYFNVAVEAQIGLNLERQLKLIFRNGVHTGQSSAPRTAIVS